MWTHTITSTTRLESLRDGEHLIRDFLEKKKKTSAASPPLLVKWWPRPHLPTKSHRTINTIWATATFFSSSSSTLYRIPKFFFFFRDHQQSD